MASQKTFKVNRTDSVSNGFITLPPGIKNGPTIGSPLSGNEYCDLLLYGLGFLEWGEGINENFIHLLENFACEEKPNVSEVVPVDESDLGPGGGINNPVKGQLWFNTTRQQLFVYSDDGNIHYWRPVSGSVTVGETQPTNPFVGDLWYNPKLQELRIWLDADNTTNTQPYSSGTYYNIGDAVTYNQTQIFVAIQDGYLHSPDQNSTYYEWRDGHDTPYWDLLISKYDSYLKLDGSNFMKANLRVGEDSNNTNSILNVSDPSNPTDGVNKRYVDNEITNIQQDYLRLDASNSPITGDLRIVGNLTVDTDTAISGRLSSQTNTLLNGITNIRGYDFVVEGVTNLQLAGRYGRTNITSTTVEYAGRLSLTSRFSSNSTTTYQEISFNNDTAAFGSNTPSVIQYSRIISDGNALKFTYADPLNVSSSPDTFLSIENDGIVTNKVIYLENNTPIDPHHVASKGYVDSRALTDLSDVLAAAPVTNQFLKFNGSNWIASNLPPVDGGVSSLGELDDVTDATSSNAYYDVMFSNPSSSTKWITGPYNLSYCADTTLGSAIPDGKVLTMLNGTWQALDPQGGGGSSSLVDLIDTNITSTANNDILAWDASGYWVPKTAAELGLSGGGATSLSDLTDTNIPASVTTGYVLKYEGGVWTPRPDNTSSTTGGGVVDYVYHTTKSVSDNPVTVSFPIRATDTNYNNYYAVISKSGLVLSSPKNIIQVGAAVSSSAPYDVANGGTDYDLDIYTALYVGTATMLQGSWYSSSILTGSSETLHTVSVKSSKQFSFTLDVHVKHEVTGTQNVALLVRMVPRSSPGLVTSGVVSKFTNRRWSVIGTG